MKQKQFLIFYLIMFFGCQEPYVDLGNGYKAAELGSFNDLGITTYTNNIIIKGQVLYYNFDSVFIIAIQRPRDSFIRCEALPYDQYKRIFENSKFRQYWIINKKSDLKFNIVTKTFSNVYGPFEKKVFLQKCKELRVSDLLFYKLHSDSAGKQFTKQLQ